MLGTPLIMLIPEPATQLSGSASKCPSCGLPLQSGVPCSCGAPGTLDLPLGASLESGVREIVVGDLFADTYRVVKKLGEGGMGTVFLARDQKLDRDVAVKVLARHLCADQAALDRFVFEARMTAKLDHPNIVAVHAVGTFHERPFIVMKLLDGVALSELAKRRREPWPWADVRPIFHQLCLGLSYLHQQKLVHRDVKPSNVNISPNGHVTLLDFGILKDTSRDRTTSGVLLGTLRYMAPEQITDASNVDARADLYALALVAWQLLTGKHAFTGDDIAIARVKLNENPPDARTMNPELPRRVAEVLNRSVDREPERRFATAEALLAALDEAFAAPPDKPSRRPLQLAALIAVTVVAGLIGTWVAFGPSRNADTTPLKIAATATPDSDSANTGAANTGTAKSATAHTATANNGADTGTANNGTNNGTANTGNGTPNTGTPTTGTANTGAPKTGQPKATDKRTPVAPKLTGSAKLSVVSMVGGKSSYAEVFVDGTSRGEAPTQLELPAGSHKIKLTREGFQPWEGNVKIVAGKPDRLVVELRGAKP